MSRGRVNYHARMLVDYNEGFIFVDYFQGESFGHQVVGFTDNERDNHQVARLDLVACPGRLAIDNDAPALDQTLRRRT
jgi:hypothetical protein